MVHALGQVALEEGQGVQGGSAQLLELVAADGETAEPLQIPHRRTDQRQLPEVSQPHLSLFAFLAARVAPEQVVDLRLLVVHQLVGVSKCRRLSIWNVI